MSVQWEKDVFSTNVAKVAWDDSNILLITWARSGRVSAYQGVPEELAEQCANAASVTTFINLMIKPAYEHSYVS